MSPEELEILRYPVGKYKVLENPNQEDLEHFIDTIEAAPAKLRATLDGLSASQLDTPYRPDGWTLRQVTHHVCDSHLNSFIRFKWTLTEDNPTIKTYHEALWAEQPEEKSGPIDLSLDLLDTLHRRWVVVLRNISAQEWNRTFVHPETNRTLNLKWLVGLYAWHGAHHTGHIQSLKDRMGW